MIHWIVEGCYVILATVLLCVGKIHEAVWLPVIIVALACFIIGDVKRIKVGDTEIDGDNDKPAIPGGKV